MSDDLRTWTISGPLWDPRRFITHECPEVFSWGDWWYLVYSEFSERFTTRYRISSSPNGPWLAPPLDSIDGRAFYAAKSVARDGRRFFVGWISSKEHSEDDGPWEWAGTMSVLEATQNADGTLAFGIPAELITSFDADHPVSFDHPDTGMIELSAPDGYVDAITAEPVPSMCLVTVDIEIGEETTECGILVRASADGVRAT